MEYLLIIASCEFAAYSSVIWKIFKGIYVNKIISAH